MVEFSMACRQHTPEQKVQRLKKCLISSFSSASLNSEAKIVNEYIDLLERQIPIDVSLRIIHCFFVNMMLFHQEINPVSSLF